MGKGERLALIQKNLAKKKEWEDAERILAYSIFIIEKEFNVGPVTGSFLHMKYLNLMDEWNWNKLSEDEKAAMNGSKAGSKSLTFGG